jgi:hypothetical protein
MLTINQQEASKYIRFKEARPTVKILNRAGKDGLNLNESPHEVFSRCLYHGHIDSYLYRVISLGNAMWYPRAQNIQLPCLTKIQ